MFKNIARKLHVTFTRADTADFFMNVVKQTISYRENHNISRNDFMHLLIQLKNNGVVDGESSKGGNLTVEEIAAQGKIKAVLFALLNYFYIVFFLFQLLSFFWVILMAYLIAFFW